MSIGRFVNVVLTDDRGFCGGGNRLGTNQGENTLSCVRAILFVTTSIQKFLSCGRAIRFGTTSIQKSLSYARGFLFVTTSKFPLGGQNLYLQAPVLRQGLAERGSR